MSATLWLDNDNMVRLAGLADALTGSLLNAATVTLTITDALGVELPGIAWPVAMNYSGTPGEYRYKVPAAVVLVEGATYTGTVSVSDTASGLIGKFSKRLGAKNGMYETRKQSK